MVLVTLKNGTTEYITSFNNACEIVDEHLGTDLARYIEQEHSAQIENLQDEISMMYSEDTAIEIFEMPKTSAIQTAYEELDQLYDEIKEAKRLNRNKILEALYKVIINLDNER